MANKEKAKASIYELKITLMHIEPAIWRRLQVEASITLARLHQIIQVVMGWENYHMHEFRVKGSRYGMPDPGGEAMFGSKVSNEKKFKLCDIAEAGDSFVYEYDFGDGWRHEIVIEKVLSAEPGIKYPVCLEGQRACPPEDCGGPWGYAELLEILDDPGHEEYDGYREWAGEDFDPESFDFQKVNKQLEGARSVV